MPAVYKKKCMFKKLGNKNDFSRSYDDKRSQKSLKITKNQTN